MKLIFSPQSLLAYSLFILILAIGGDYSISVPLPSNQTVPAVIVFGDSIVDPGNNNNIKTIVKCNFPPYGRDFTAGQPTGRFGNGRVASDVAAEIFNVKKILPAYLDPNLQLQDLVSGVSFASGGAGYDPLTSELVSVISLSDQLDLFREYKGKLKEAIGEDKAESIISKSVYFVCVGSDDIANTYFSTPLRKPHYDIQSYTDLMLNSATTFFQELYGEGARRIGVVSVPAIGCVPSQRTLSGDIERGCSDSANQAAILFNSKLSSQIASINNKFPEARLVYLDFYNPLLFLIRDPASYGFEEATKGCCGTGNLEVSILCNPYTINSCSDASKYIFWDSYHPSEKAYVLLVNRVLDNKIDKFF
ncbi:GDSL esterase/lipase EXL3-like [Ziziphus jujuba]|uniref:GDSL esterase/lipase EXL3-like n=1 Tax=Ziziphus jujuba TaxID=326968 RepID=A0ABM3IUJ6_ZIZJJ|nr:GDSL esterase/lipase EXL3-like [Ziziphus jujuba]